jgi:hypothetical protein
MQGRYKNSNRINALNVVSNGFQRVCIFVDYGGWHAVKD